MSLKDLVVDRATIAWAGAKDGGPPEVWSVCPTKKKAFERVPEGAMAAHDYQRLNRRQRWALARKNGWRVVKVSITRVRP